MLVQMFLHHKGVTMHAIVKKEVLSPQIKLIEVEAPAIARKAQPGQFIMLRIDDAGERIPLTIADFDRERGTLTLIFQEVGKTTLQLGTLKVGDTVRDLAGPLGHPSEITNTGTVVCVGGGVGVAPLFPITRALHQAGNRVVAIIGARNHDLLFREEKMRAVSQQLFVTTDDGSYGRHGFVTDQLKDVLVAEKVGLVYAIGPVPMMRAVAETTRATGIKTIVSLNPIMIDGTGMCGGCRVTVGGQTKFACVDGPEFDGHQVNFLELTSRQKTYLTQEKAATALQGAK
jgi:ferredoxin--NADP+ reductase